MWNKTRLLLRLRFSFVVAFNILLYFRRRTIKMIHPVVALAIAGLVVVFVAMVGQPIEDSMPYIVFIVLLALPMLIVSLCINFRGFE